MIIGCPQSTSQPPHHFFRSSPFPSFLLCPNLRSLLGSGRLYSRAVPLGLLRISLFLRHFPSQFDRFCSFRSIFIPQWVRLAGPNIIYNLLPRILDLHSVNNSHFLHTCICEDSVDQSLQLKLPVSLSAFNYTPSRLDNHLLSIFHQTLPSI